VEKSMTVHNGLLVETLVNGALFENCYLVADTSSHQGILIDPGDEAERILTEVRRLNVDVQRIINTHGHVDHAGAVASLKRLLSVPFAIHPEENGWLARLPQQAAAFGLPETEAPEVEEALAHGQTITLGNKTATVLHTPGHSAGGCCFYFADSKVVFVGDTLFADSIGRTDLPGGSLENLIISIKTHLLSLSDDVIVYCGHGPTTTIGQERRHNPFLQPEGYPLG
jgi:glyoxylase-like metal-dependent hydrolase (beta-lactamase superfamily II)